MNTPHNPFPTRHTRGATRSRRESRSSLSAVHPGNTITHTKASAYSSMSLSTKALASGPSQCTLERKRARFSSISSTLRCARRTSTVWVGPGVEVGADAATVFEAGVECWAAEIADVMGWGTCAGDRGRLHTTLRQAPSFEP